MKVARSKNSTHKTKPNALRIHVFIKKKGEDIRDYSSSPPPDGLTRQREIRCLSEVLLCTGETNHIKNPTEA